MTEREQPLRCVVKFTSTNLLESFRQCASSGKISRSLLVFFLFKKENFASKTFYSSIFYHKMAQLSSKHRGFVIKMKSFNVIKNKFSLCFLQELLPHRSHRCYHQLSLKAEIISSLQTTALVKLPKQNCNKTDFFFFTHLLFKHLFLCF